MNAGRRGPAPGVRNDWYGLALAMLRDIEERGMDQAAAVAAAAARSGRKASTLEHMVQVGRYVRDKGPAGDVRGTLSVFQVLRSVERRAPDRVPELFRIALTGEIGRTGMQALVREAVAGRAVAWPPPPRPTRRRAGGPAASPRALVPEATFDAMVSWLAGIAGEGDGRGFLVGVGDRHSGLAFSACARACEALGRPGAAVAVCFVPHEDAGMSVADVAAWASSLHPGARVDVARDSEAADAPGRWATLARRRGGAGGPRLVGSRTATGLWLGDYDDLARSASVEPFASLWDTEVAALCDGVGIPHLGGVATGGHPARGADPLALDLALMARAGMLAREHVASAVDPDSLASLDAIAASASPWPASDAPARFAAPVTA